MNQQPENKGTSPMAKHSLGASLSQARNLQPHSLETVVGWRYIWATTIFVWLLSLLPWRSWAITPDILLVVIAFWSFHEPRRMGMVAAFCFGLTLDVHDVGPLGLQALLYALVVYGTQLLHRRLMRFDLLRQAMHLLPLFVGAKLVTVLIGTFIVSAWPGWAWLPGVLLTVACWPPVGWLLLLPQHRMDDVGTGIR